jgi:hypothetical protein
MVVRKQQHGHEWLDEGIRHLQVLCTQAKEYADVGDILPSDLSVARATEILRMFHNTPAPRMTVTVNGDIALTWENTSDSFEACIKTDGSVLFYRNTLVVTKASFTRYLNNAVPA